jgi:hypothetical protein
VGEAVTVLTEGLAAPICVPAVVASIGGDVVANAKAQIDLVFDLASIHGAPFDVDDTDELAVVLDLALFGGRAGPWPGPGAADEILARIGRGLLEDAALALVPFVGIPFSAVGNYRAALRAGAVARGWIRRRVALRDALVGLGSSASSALLLEGAWLLATADGVATHEELLVLAALARALPGEERPGVSCLDAVDEGAFLARAAALAPGDRAALVGGLVVVAGLRGPTRHPEQRFLARVGDATGLAIDLRRVDAIHRALDGGPRAAHAGAMSSTSPAAPAGG